MRNTFSYEATLLHIRNFHQYSSYMYIEEKEHLDELGGYLKAKIFVTNISMKYPKPLRKESYCQCVIIIENIVEVCCW